MPGDEVSQPLRGGEPNAAWQSAAAPVCGKARARSTSAAPRRYVSSPPICSGSSPASPPRSTGRRTAGTHRAACRRAARTANPSAAGQRATIGFLADDARRQSAPGRRRRRSRRRAVRRAAVMPGGSRWRTQSISGHGEPGAVGGDGARSGDTPCIRPDGDRGQRDPIDSPGGPLTAPSALDTPPPRPRRDKRR